MPDNVNEYDFVLMSWRPVAVSYSFLQIHEDSLPALDYYLGRYTPLIALYRKLDLYLAVIAPGRFGMLFTPCGVSMFFNNAMTPMVQQHILSQFRWKQIMTQFIPHFYIAQAAPCQ